MVKRMRFSSLQLCFLAVLTIIPLFTGCTTEGPDEDRDASRGKRLLLLGQGPDGHPAGTHEFMAGVRILSHCLKRFPGVEAVIVAADEPWEEGPALLDSADGLVLFVSEGAKWMSNAPARLAALQRFGRKGGSCVVLHWGMGTVEAKNIAEFVKLFGGCHGGPDRKHDTMEVTAIIPDPSHPVTRGIADFDVHDEFYYRLKFVQPFSSIIPLVQADIEGKRETVAWAWQRGDGGRSFGFSGLHFHKNWQHPQYRRLAVQAVLWTLDLPVPDTGVNVDVPEELLRLE